MSHRIRPSRAYNTPLLATLLGISLSFLFWGPRPTTTSVSPITTSKMIVEEPATQVEAKAKLDPDIQAAFDAIREASNPGSTEKEESAGVVDSDSTVTQQVVEDENPKAKVAADSIPQVEQPKSDIKTVQLKVKDGDNLTKIWHSVGGSRIGAIKAEAALKSAGAAALNLRIGSIVILQIKDGEVISLERKLKTGETIYLTGNSVDGYKVEKRVALITEKVRTVHGTINNSFASAAQQSGVPYAAIDELVDLFSARVEFRRDIQPGDSFAVTFTSRHLGDEDATLKPIISAATLTTGGRKFAVIKHTGTDGVARYYNEAGEAIGSYFLRYPLQFTKISSAFSTARFHPVLGINRPHNGVDFAAPTGTPVRSVGDGIIVDVGYRGEAGNLVKIAHGNRFTTAYLHLSKISPGLRVGSRVSRGQLIGAVGMTGLATGPHLHFSLFDKGTFVNPLAVDLPSIPSSSERLPRNVLLAALNTLDRGAAITVADASVGRRNPKA